MIQLKTTTFVFEYVSWLDFVGSKFQFSKFENFCAQIWNICYAFSLTHLTHVMHYCPCFNSIDMCCHTWLKHTCIAPIYNINNTSPEFFLKITNISENVNSWSINWITLITFVFIICSCKLVLYLHTIHYIVNAESL